MPTVSVVISAYQRQNLLPRAVESALRQRDADLDLDIVDNLTLDAPTGWFGCMEMPSDVG